MQQVISRPDPAPSRWSYRMQRLMLTPVFRKLLRVGLPFAVTLAAGTIWFADEGRRDALNNGIADIRHQIETRPEFMVNMMAIDGASVTVAEEIREIVPLEFPLSSFDLDLPSILNTVRELPAVSEASVHVRTGGVLQLDIKERVPVVLWRTRDGLELLDTGGVAIGPVELREDRSDLPLIAGEGAESAVPQALAILRAAGPLVPRVRGLVRMGERRWDLVLDREQRILLPEVLPVQALERVIVLGQAQDMLARDLTVVDMRLAERPTIRMGAAASDQWWHVKETVLGTGRQ